MLLELFALTGSNANNVLSYVQDIAFLLKTRSRFVLNHNNSVNSSTPRFASRMIARRSDSLMVLPG